MRGIERAPGDEVGGYRVVRPLGRGGSGAVYLVEDHGGAQSALKLVDASDGGARVRLAREVAALQALRHRAVPRVLDAELDDADPFVVFEFVDGPSLAAHVARHGALAPDAVADLARTLGSALGAVHAAGVVHRDVTPSNVLVSPDGPVLIDFGLSHGVADERLTQTGLVSGTSGYVAPEVIDGAEPNPASDDWALVATLAFAAAGTAPFGTGPGALRATLDGAARAEVPFALARALTSAPQFRPPLASLIASLSAGTEVLPAGGLVPPTQVMPAGAGFAGWAEIYQADLDEADADGDGSPQWDSWSAENEGDVEDDPDGDGADSDDEDWDGEADEEWDEDAAPAYQRRRTVLLAWAIALVSLSAVAPGLAALLLLVLVITARTVEYAARGVQRSRTRRDSDTGGVGPQLLASPWHVARALVTGAPSVVLAALVAGGICVLGWWITSFLAEPALWRAAVLALAAVGAVVVVARGPGAAATRTGSHRVAAAFTPSREWQGGWVALAVVATVILLGVAFAGIAPLGWPLPPGTLDP